METIRILAQILLGAIAAGVSGYLMYVLVKPEKF